MVPNLHVFAWFKKYSQFERLFQVIAKTGQASPSNVGTVGTLRSRFNKFYVPSFIVQIVGKTVFKFRTIACRFTRNVGRKRPLKYAFRQSSISFRSSSVLKLPTLHSLGLRSKNCAQTV